MNAMTLEYPDTLLVALGVDASRFATETRMAAAMKLFEVGKFTSGQAAEFAGVSRAEFLLACREWGVDSVKWDEREVAAEFSQPLPQRG
jgi:predicted HTH domain antitoxin